MTHLADNHNAYELSPDGTYEAVSPKEGEKAVDSQAIMMEMTRDFQEIDSSIC
jgi:polyphosphate kinase